MRNLYLDDKTRDDIDQRIDRIHKDLGRTDRPIELAEVRSFLRLDLGYYTADDPHLVREVVHSLKLGAKVVIDAPRMLLDTVKKFDLRALLLWKPKRILIDQRLHDLKKRWSEAHEIAHSVIPWHEHYSLGDDQSTLSPACHEQIEAEANYGAGRLLFPPGPFTKACASSPATLAHIRALSDCFGNSITTTLWRFVEGSPGVTLGVISQHPHHVNVSEPTVDHLVLSRRMLQEFPAVSENDLFTAMRTYCNRRRGGPIGTGVTTLVDANGNLRTLALESFANTHRVLTLGYALD